MPGKERVYYEEEVVEDSEPEREALRRAHMVQHEVSYFTEDEPEPSCSKNLPESDDSTSDHGITSRAPPKRTSSSPPAPSALDASERRIIIEISDSSMESSGPRQPLRTNIPILTGADHVAQYDLSGSESDDDETFPSLRLAKFAFSSACSAGPSKPHQPKVAHFHTARPDFVQAPARGTTSKKAAVVSTRYLSNFSDAELSRLLKCVCCDVRWTTRKSAAQKLTHIKSCAKKSLLKDDTVISLVHKELSNPPAPDPKGKGRSKGVPEDPVTLMNEVVQHTAPKKKARKEVSNTVRDLGETREAILERARFVVAQGASAVRAMREQNIITTNNVHHDPPLLLDDTVSSTPGFGKSALARRLGSKTKDLFLHDPGVSSQEIDERYFVDIEPTVHSAPSRDSVLTDSDNHSVQITGLKKLKPIISNFRSDAPIIYVPSSSSEASVSPSERNRSLTSPLHTPTRYKPISPISSPPQAPSPRANPEDEEELLWDDPYRREIDAAYLHYDPEHEISSNPGHFSQPTTPPEPKQFLDPPLDIIPVRPSKTTAKAPSTSLPRNSITTSPIRRKRTPRKDRDIVQAETLFDEEWQLGLKEKILSDTALHLRILRYEPIDFNVFLAMVHDGSGKPSNKLKDHLQAFLDKQAINFYCGVGSSRGRRR